MTVLEKTLIKAELEKREENRNICTIKLTCTNKSLNYLYAVFSQTIEMTDSSLCNLYLPESDVKLTVVLQICGHSPERRVLQNILPFEEADDNPLLGL